MLGIFDAIRRQVLLRRPFPPPWRAIVAERLPFSAACPRRSAARFEDRRQRFAWRYTSKVPQVSK